MAITGHLAEFSLAEIFQFLDQGHKTGLLTITPLPEPLTPTSTRSHYVWFSQGRVVGAANRSDHRGLITLIAHRGWLGDNAAARLGHACGPGMPLGICLKSQGILQAEQLKLLFYSQVMRQVCALFMLPDAWFHFDSSVVPPNDEMTGLSAPATEVTLAGLRALRDWDALQDKLPSLDSALVSIIEGKPHLRLNQSEWKVWEFTDGQTPLSAIAVRLNMTGEQIKQVAFRLIIVGLVEEVPLVTTQPEPKDRLEAESALMSSVESSEPAMPVPSVAANGNSGNLSQSFLQNLMGFLKGQA